MSVLVLQILDYEVNHLQAELQADYPEFADSLATEDDRLSEGDIGEELWRFASLWDENSHELAEMATGVEDGGCIDNVLRFVSPRRRYGSPEEAISCEVSLFYRKIMCLMTIFMSE